MSDLDLNLLVALDALLSERSVVGAARKLGLSPSAMSRALSRLRGALGDPVLVQAGRAMAPTPHAEAIAEEVRSLNAAVQAVLSPAPPADISTLQRDFTVRANEAFVLIHAARLCAAMTATAPGFRLRFVPKPNKDIVVLRDGSIDLDIGVMTGDSGELRAQTLYHDSFVGVVGAGHQLLHGSEITAASYAAAGHAVASRSGHGEGPVDEALAAMGLRRDVKVVVPGFPAVLAVVGASDLVGLVPRSFSALRIGEPVVSFDLPVQTPAITIAQIWHPRLDADPAHRWLRNVIFEAFRKRKKASLRKVGAGDAAPGAY